MDICPTDYPNNRIALEHLEHFIKHTRAGPNKRWKTLLIDSYESHGITTRGEINLITEYFAFTHASFCFRWCVCIFFRFNHKLSATRSTGARFCLLLAFSSINLWAVFIFAAAYPCATRIQAPNLWAVLYDYRSASLATGVTCWTDSAWYPCPRKTKSFASVIFVVDCRLGRRQQTWLAILAAQAK